MTLVIRIDQGASTGVPGQNRFDLVSNTPVRFEVVNPTEGKTYVWRIVEKANLASVSLTSVPGVAGGVAQQITSGLNVTPYAMLVEVEESYWGENAWDHATGPRQSGRCCCGVRTNTGLRLPLYGEAADGAYPNLTNTTAEGWHAWVLFLQTLILRQASTVEFPTGSAALPSQNPAMRYMATGGDSPFAAHADHSHPDQSVRVFQIGPYYRDPPPNAPPNTPLQPVLDIFYVFPNFTYYTDKFYPFAQHESFADLPQPPQMGSTQDVSAKKWDGFSRYQKLIFNIDVQEGARFLVMQSSVGTYLDQIVQTFPLGGVIRIVQAGDGPVAVRTNNGPAPALAYSKCIRFISPNTLEPVGLYDFGLTTFGKGSYIEITKIHSGALNGKNELLPYTGPPQYAQGYDEGRAAYLSEVWLAVLGGGGGGGGSGGSGGSAAGDLGGTYPAPKVVRLQGRDMAPTIPTEGQVLSYVTEGTSGAWRPTTVPGTSTATGGDLQGPINNVRVKALWGRTVANHAPTDGYVLTWNAFWSQWEPAEAPGIRVIPLAGDVEGPFDPGQTVQVVRLRGRILNDKAPAVGEALVWNGYTWIPTAQVLPPASGDVQGTYPALTVKGLQGKAVAATAPAADALLRYDDPSKAWTPTPMADVAKKLNAGGDVGGYFDKLTVNRIQGQLVGFWWTPQPGQVLTWDNTFYEQGCWRPMAIPPPPVPIVPLQGDVNGTSDATRVQGLQGFPISSAQPGYGHALMWDDTNQRWEPRYPASANPTLGGDVTGPFYQAKVTGIQGYRVSEDNPYYDDILAWNGDEYCWKPVRYQSLAIAGDLGGVLGAAKVTALQGKPVAAFTPAEGDTLQYVGGRWEPRRAGAEAGPRPIQTWTVAILDDVPGVAPVDIGKVARVGDDFYILVGIEGDLNRWRKMLLEAPVTTTGGAMANVIQNWDVNDFSQITDATAADIGTVARVAGVFYLLTAFDTAPTWDKILLRGVSRAESLMIQTDALLEVDPNNADLPMVRQLVADVDRYETLLLFPQTSFSLYGITKPAAPAKMLSLTLVNMSPQRTITLQSFSGADAGNQLYWGDSNPLQLMPGQQITFFYYPQSSGMWWASRPNADAGSIRGFPIDMSDAGLGYPLSCLMTDEQMPYLGFIPPVVPQWIAYIDGPAYWILDYRAEFWQLPDPAHGVVSQAADYAGVRLDPASGVSSFDATSFTDFRVDFIKPVELPDFSPWHEQLFYFSIKSGRDDGEWLEGDFAGIHFGTVNNDVLDATFTATQILVQYGRPVGQVAGLRIVLGTEETFIPFDTGTPNKPETRFYALLLRGPEAFVFVSNDVNTYLEDEPWTVVRTNGRLVYRGTRPTDAIILPTAKPRFGIHAVHQDSGLSNVIFHDVSVTYYNPILSLDQQ